MYMMLKHSHMMLVGISFGLFLWRFLAFKARNRVLPRLLRFLPHIVDTLLLLSALSLVNMVGYSWQSPWLIAKVLTLLGYICFGVMAMRGQGTLKWLGFLFANLCFIYIVMVAITKTPWGLLLILTDTAV